MTWPEFFVIFLSCAIAMLICRTVPLFVLKGKELDERVAKALSFIPPAAFAALVANEVFNLGLFTGFNTGVLIPLIAAIPVFIVAWFSRSLVISAVVGVAAFALLTFLF